MAIIHLFHGTSGNNAINIMQEGFDGFSKETIWDCAEMEKTYLYNLDKLIEVECMEDYDEKDQINRAMEMANENAQIIATFENNPLNYTVVFEFIIDTNTTNFMNFVEEDNSCENMADCGAVQVDCDILNDFIKRGKIERILHFFPFFPKFSFVYINSLVENKYLTEKIEKMDDRDRRLLQKLHHIDLSGIMEEIIFVDEIEKPKSFHF